MVVPMTNRPTIKGIQSILSNNKKSDAEQELKRKTETANNHYGFMRGAAYYGGADKDEWTDDCQTDRDEDERPMRNSHPIAIFNA